MAEDYAQECGQDRLSARVTVRTPLHPYWGAKCYLVRSDHSRTFLNHKYLLEIIGQPNCRDWFGADEIIDTREYSEMDEEM